MQISITLAIFCQSPFCLISEECIIVLLSLYPVCLEVIVSIVKCEQQVINLVAANVKYELDKSWPGIWKMEIPAGDKQRRIWCGFRVQECGK